MFVRAKNGKTRFADGAISERILVPYDGSASADETVGKAINLARAQGASLYVLAIAPGEDELKASSLPVGNRLMNDLIAFARLGTHLGIDIDGSYLDSPTDALLRAVIEMRRIDRVVIAGNENRGNTSRNENLLKTLVANCPVPVTLLA